MALFARRRWPWAVAAAVTVAVVALVATLLTRDEPAPTVTGDPDIVETADPVPEPTLPTVAFDALVRAPDRELRSYADHSTAAENAPVESVVGPSAVWVGTPQDRVLVVVVSSDFRVERGARLSFQGVVQRGTKEFGQALGLRGAALEEFGRQLAYVEITEYRTN